MKLASLTHAGRSVRTVALRRASAALLCLGLTAPGLAVDKSWNAGDGDWGDPANWTPFGVPSDFDEIRIGNLPGVQDSTVMLTPLVTSYDYLEISDGMILDMNHNELISFDAAWIVGDNSRLIARKAIGLNDHDFQGDLHVGAGAHFELADNAPVRIFQSDSFGTISGQGSILVSSIFPFDNNGVIQPINNGGLTIQQGEHGDYPIDLDGSAGSGALLLDTPFAALTVYAESLTDSFSGSITMVPGAAILMDVGPSWTADQGSFIDIIGTNNPNAASQINGSDWIFDGTMNINSFQAHLRVLSDVTFAQNADVTVAFTDWLELDGATTLDGAEFLLGHSGILDFDGQTTVKACTFNTNSGDPANGSVDFNGPTTWNGGCDVNGVARVFGNAFVAGPTVVNAETFDMDGDGDTQWTVWNDLVINAESVQTDNPEDFHGTINVANTPGRLTVNLPGAAIFSMAGEMNLTGHPSVFHTRYAGALDLLGDLNVSGKVVMDALLLAFDGAIDIGDANAVLRLDDRGHIAGGCSFTGDGELRIGPGGKLLFTNVDLGTVGLVNQGELRARPIASVDRFANEAGSVWEVALDGIVAGVDHDQLVVANNATLGGNLDITLLNGFRPDPGDSFTVLTSSALAGAFDNVANGGRLFTTGGEGSLIVSYDGTTDTVVLSGYTCAGDLNLDGQVSFADLLVLLAAWETPGGDTDGDGDTDFNDVLVLLVAWGDCP